MSRHWNRRITALLVALAMCAGLPAAAEELGEMDLYDPAIYAGELPAPEEAPAPEPEWQPVDWEIAEEPAQAGDAAVPEQAAPDGQSATEEPAPQIDDGDAADPGSVTDAGSVTDPGSVTDAAPEVVEAPEIVLELGEPDAGVAAPEDAESGEAEVMAAEVSREAEPDLMLGLGEQYALEGASGCVSDRPEVVSVDAAGTLTANALGRAVISFTGANGATATRLVAVLNAPDALSFSETALTLGKGESLSLAPALPANSAAARFSYVSSRPNTVSVDENGVVYARRTGSAVITATAYNGVQASCAVKVAKAPGRVRLSATKLVLAIGEGRALTAKLPSKTASRIRWTSDNEAVVSVDGSGNVKGVAAGTATITATTFNNRSARCKVVVLDGAAPTSVTFGVDGLRLGLGEKFLLSPAVGAGEAAVYAFTSSRKAVATVSSGGVVTAKKKGTARITVRTHNGLKATIPVKVAKAPSKVTLSQSTMVLEAGQTARLTAKLPSGSGSALKWESSDASVATVDGSGLVTGVKAGEAAIRVSAFNGKYDLCKVAVVAPDTPADSVTVPTPEVPQNLPAAARMAANLRASKTLGAKRDAIANVVELLINSGFEPAFAAGVGANIYSEGTYGLFESSKYIANYKKRPRYFCYLDGGDYYTSQDGEYVLTAVYMSQEEMAAYTGEAEARLRFGEENYYRDNFSGKYAQNVDLTALEAFLDKLAEGKWEGKFGLGIVQWTGGRTRTLVKFYRKHAGEGSTAITAEQVMAAENEMILFDLTGAYASVYNAWKADNADALNCADAAKSAGALVCTKYEIPVNKEAKAITRGSKAAEIYSIMVG